MSDSKIRYNIKSAETYGWTPEWFGHKNFDEDLLRAIRVWQKMNGLNADGLCGPSTYRRKWTEREATIHNYKPTLKDTVTGFKDNHIVHNGNFLPIEWDKVVLWTEANGLRMKRNTYTDFSGKEDRKPHMFVNHWDVCLSSESCAKVLNKRGISVHFCIDNDGTIYQLLDTQHKAWHAGIRNGVGGNEKGIGVEIANAYYPKYQGWYMRNGFGERPVAKDVSVHGRKLDPFLDFYPVQIEALLALWKALHEGIGIPYNYPKMSDGSLNRSVDKACVRGTFEGFCNHYNFTEGKIDCANLDIKELLKKIE